MKEILYCGCCNFQQPCAGTARPANKILDEVVVTATKSEVKQSQTGKVVSVIDQAALQT
jgi:outer membrane cobalamin receptor